MNHEKPWNDILPFPRKMFLDSPSQFCFCTPRDGTRKCQILQVDPYMKGMCPGQTNTWCMWQVEVSPGISTRPLEPLMTSEESTPVFYRRLHWWKGWMVPQGLFMLFYLFFTPQKMDPMQIPSGCMYKNDKTSINKTQNWVRTSSNKFPHTCKMKFNLLKLLASSKSLNE